MNRIVLVGRLTRDPELKYTPQGIPVAQMGLAVSRISKDENGQYETDFFDVVAWRRSAEYAGQYLKKGNMIAVDGRLQTRSWVAQDGQKRKSFEIVAENVNGLDRKGDEAASGGMGDGAGDNERAAPMERSAPAERSASQERSAPAAQAARPAAGAQPARKPVATPADDDMDESDPFADE